MIRVVCTGKDSHREKGCGHTFDYGPLSTATLRLGDDRRLVVTNEKKWDDWREGGKPLKSSYTFTCRRCQPIRETRMKAKTLRRALDGLRANGQATLDISQLPF